jgi:GAF domain-containing protein
MTEPLNGLNHAALLELAGLLTASDSFEQMMQSACELAARLVPAAATCAITLAQDGHAITIGSADALARQLDEQQYDLDQGPCLQAMATGEIVSSPDLSREERWDGYPPRAVANGISSIYSSPLRVNDAVIGALNMYAEAVDAFDDEARAVIALLTALTGVTISTAMGHFDETQLSDHLRRALSNRSVIDQAIGIVIASQHCSPGEAFDVLRTVSQNRNIKLRDVAAEVVERTSAGPPAATR